MKRKTNLFYLSGEESNFITFSNYGESLTGNFLATNWKLFPTKFLCFYIPGLDVDDEKVYEKRKHNLINYLSRYYENKLAFLRDYCIESNIDIEKKLKPLNYLLECLFKITGFDQNNNIIYDTYLLNNINSFDDIKTNIKLSFVGDISEQDYNGTYTDIINIIHNADTPKGYIDILNNDIAEADINIPYNEDNKEKYLYGWDKSDVNGNMVSPIYDYTNNEDMYTISSRIKGIDLSFSEKSNNTNYHKDNKNIKFNILIPLYDLVDISKYNDTEIVEQIDYIDLSNIETGYIKNVPMGMWFASTTIDLKRNLLTNYAPSWSLLLSAQFKPFPYSQKMPNEITQDATKDAFATYSQVLTRQNALMSKLELLSEEINKINTRLNNIEYTINNSGQTAVDKIQKEVMVFENVMQNDMAKFKEEIFSYITNTWKGYIG